MTKIPPFTKNTGKIAFQGANGANSDTACREVFPELEPVACETFEDAFAVLKRGDVDLAMIPIENSLAGRVADIHHLLPRSTHHIIGEFFQPIHFHLLANKGTKLEDIKAVHSHVHALGQCRKILRKHGWQAKVHADTAGAAQMISQDPGDRENAALAPILAAQLYDLDVLAENVEDEAHNTTRFVILSNEAIRAQAGDGKIITSFVFQVRNIPAALYKAMGGFATNGVNMTKLESYQLDGKFYATQFYADIEGHPDDKNVTLAFDELRYFCKEFRILGVYCASPFRALARER